MLSMEEEESWAVLELVVMVTVFSFFWWGLCAYGKEGELNNAVVRVNC